MEYVTIKWIHIISSTLLFGTGLGSAFYKFMTDRSKDVRAIAVTNRIVVLADWLFTTPAVVIQPLTGFILLDMSGYNLLTPWVYISLILFVVAGVCWVPVVILQIKMRHISDAAVTKGIELSSLYWKYVRIWFYLGVPAFISVMAIFYLMTNKPSF